MSDTNTTRPIPTPPDFQSGLEKAKMILEEICSMPGIEEVFESIRNKGKGGDAYWMLAVVETSPEKLVDDARLETVQKYFYGVTQTRVNLEKAAAFVADPRFGAIHGWVRETLKNPGDVTGDPKARRGLWNAVRITEEVFTNYEDDLPSLKLGYEILGEVLDVGWVLSQLVHGWALPKLQDVNEMTPEEFEAFILHAGERRSVAKAMSFAFKKLLDESRSSGGWEEAEALQRKLWEIASKTDSSGNGSRRRKPGKTRAEVKAAKAAKAAASAEVRDRMKGK